MIFKQFKNFLNTSKQRRSTVINNRLYSNKKNILIINLERFFKIKPCKRDFDIKIYSYTYILRSAPTVNIMPAFIFEVIDST